MYKIDVASGKPRKTSITASGTIQALGAENPLFKPLMTTARLSNSPECKFYQTWTKQPLI
jgi:hypothetical protein